MISCVLSQNALAKEVNSTFPGSYTLELQKDLSYRPKDKDIKLREPELAAFDRESFIQLMILYQDKETYREVSEKQEEQLSVCTARNTLLTYKVLSLQESTSNMNHALQLCELDRGLQSDALEETEENSVKEKRLQRFKSIIIPLATGVGGAAVGFVLGWFLIR